MSPLKEVLQSRFGKHRVSDIPVKEGEMPLLVLDLEMRSPVTVIMTNGLSEYKMPVPKKLQGEEFNELYFCLPSYWKWEAVDNRMMNWIFPWIQKLAKHVAEKETWFGHGHTMEAGKEVKALSETMQQNHFILLRPLLLENELQTLEVGGKSVHFLAIVPIFEDEMDYKQGKGTFKFLQKLNSHGVTELLDDYRSTVLKSKWRLRWLSREKK